jgi:hypothetical protein
MIKIKVKKSTSPRFYNEVDVKSDPFYLEGYRDGLVIGATKNVEKLLLEGSFSIEDIIEITEQTEDFVLSIKSRLVQEGKLLPRFESIST